MSHRTVAMTAGLSLVLLFLVAGCSPEKTSGPTGTLEAEAASQSVAEVRVIDASIDSERIRNADTEPGNWLSHGRTYDEQRFSPLSQINEASIAKLGLAWYWDTDTVRGLEATPIVVDGAMFSTGAWSKVWAHDARTGRLLWEYDPDVPRAWGKWACCDVVNRGAAAYDGKIFSGTLDGRLIALDAGTGKLVWEVQTTPTDKPYTITGAPRVVDGKVVIGNGGAEYGVRGYVTAFDTRTGKLLWRFYTVPGDPSDPFESPALEKAASTWLGGKWWEVGGGGTVWDSMAYDPELKLLYVGVGNGSPWNRDLRSPGGGDNLYLSSILALNPDDGSLVWHYQTTPGDNWDYTATQHMILADLEINGASRKVIMQAPKNGFFYVLDRATGELLSAEAYVPVTWASHVDAKSGRPVENPDANYANEAKLIFPSPYGGHNWHPMSYNPNTQLVYIPALDMPFRFAQDNAFEYDPETWNTGLDFSGQPPTPEQLIQGLQTVRGHLAAWDPVSQQEVWRIQHAMTWNGGLLSTAGNLVFQGRADGTFAAYTADSGELLWEYPVNVGIIAPPVTYTVDGEQYVAVLAGWGGAFAFASGVGRHRGNVLARGRILAFKLGGSERLPAIDVTYIDIPEPPELATPPELVERGRVLYARHCSVCHGPGAVSANGAIADLRYGSADMHAAWDAIVLGGAYKERSMPGFAAVLEKGDGQALQAFIVAQARSSIELCRSEYRKNYPELLNTACTRPQVSEAAN